MFCYHIKLAEVFASDTYSKCNTLTCYIKIYRSRVNIMISWEKDDEENTNVSFPQCSGNDWLVLLKYKKYWTTHFKNNSILSKLFSFQASISSWSLPRHAGPATGYAWCPRRSSPRSRAVWPSGTTWAAAILARWTFWWEPQDVDHGIEDIFHCEYTRYERHTYYTFL